MVPLCSDRVSRAPPYSRMSRILRIRGYHPLRPTFPCRSACLLNTTGLIRVRSPLLAESLLMSFPPGTEMFQFPGFASYAYVFSARYPIGVGCPIRTLRDQSLLAAPPEFSQRATSFIASWCQGIHRMPLLRSITLQAPPAPTKHGRDPIMRRNHPRTRDRPKPGDPPRTRSAHPPLSTHTFYSRGTDGHHTRRAAAPLSATPPSPGDGRRSLRGGATHPSVRNAIAPLARSH